eukprot:gene10324-11395_t
MEDAFKRFDLEDFTAKIEERINDQITKKFENLELIDAIHTKLDALPTKLEKKLDDIPKEMYSKALERNINGNDEKIASNIGAIVRDTLNEDKQMQEKEEETERSVVIHGIQEENVKNYDERLEIETEKISKLIKDGMKITVPVIHKIHRCGKYDENRKSPRPIKIVFKDKMDRNKVLRNAPNLKAAEDIYRSCYVKKDMNTDERKEYQEQLQMAKEKGEREENKDKFYVVRGYPSKWRIEERALRK